MKKEDNSKLWLKCCKISLYQQDKNTLLNGWLSDIHINAAQAMLKQQFNDCGGLQPTYYQLKKPLVQVENAIQILHIQNNHWAVITTIGCDLPHVRYYDSSYS